MDRYQKLTLVAVVVMVAVFLGFTGSAAFRHTWGLLALIITELVLAAVMVGVALSWRHRPRR